MLTIPQLILLLSLVLARTSWAQEQPTASHQLAQDIPYRTDSALSDHAKERCRLDVYWPTRRPGFATVIWFHGGGLTEGRKSIPAGLKGKDVAVVAAGYRLAPHVKAPVYIQDAAAAVAWTFRNISRYGGSTNLIFLSGHSAGGYLSAMVGLDKRWLAAEGLDANQIAGLIPLSPQAITHFTIRSERGIGPKQPVLDEFAPLYHVRKDAPPILLITGDREKELYGRYEENAYLWRMLKVGGHADAELRELPGYDHGKMAEPALPFLLEFIAHRTRPTPSSAP